MLHNVSQKYCLVSRKIIISCVIVTLSFIYCTPKSSNQQFPRAEIKDYKGVPTLYINGIPNSGMTYMTYDPQEKYYRAFGEIGVNLASFQTSANYNLYWSDPTVWVNRDSFDFSLLDERMEMIVRANPNVWIFPRVYLWSSPWWDKENPDELMRYQDGTAEKSMEHISEGKRKTSNPSWASEKWRKDTGYCLQKFIEHVRSKPYGKRVIGYHIASGVTEEWFYWGAHTENFVDYSRPQTESFRRWLREKYKTDEALQTAWNNKKMTFDKVAIPLPKERIHTDLMFFRDPEVSRSVMDYYLFHSHLIAETIAYFGKVVKEATNGENLYGAFYGYTLARYSCVDGGHLALGELLDDPNVDFLTSPTEYAYRDVGVGYSDLRTEIKSIQLHNRYWFDENDYRTYLTPKTGWGWSDNFSDSKSQQIRQLASEITRASGAWWFDMGGGWYDSPEFMEVIKRLNSIAERSIQVNRQSSAEIAMVVDENSLAVVETDSNFTRQLLAGQRFQIGHIGASADYLLTDDLAKAPDYKMYIFVSAFHITPEQRKEIERLKDRGAKAIVWIYAPGFIGEKSLDIQGTRDVTGMKISYSKEKGIPAITITGSGAKALSGVKEGLMYGATERQTGPIFYGDDPQSEVLGILKNYNKPGLIRKKVNGVQVYYSAGPCIASSILRAIALEVGIHIYNVQDDAFNGNRSFISIHTNEAGQRTIRLPQITDVYDVYNDKSIGKQVQEFTVDFPAHHTALYYIGSEDEWLKTKK